MMAASSSSWSSNKMRMTLRIDPKRDKVVYAEASERVIEFLFDFLRVPIGYSVSLEKNKKNIDGMVGSLGKLYQGIENLDGNYITKAACPVITKKRYLYPSPSVPPEIARHLPCTKVWGQSCCYRAPFMKDMLTFMVMDDLYFQPLSTSNVQKLLKELDVDFFALQEKVVELGDAEGIQMFKAALQSKTVLTSVFINKNILVNDENIKKRKLDTAAEVKQECQGGRDARVKDGEDQEI